MVTAAVRPVSRLSRAFSRAGMMLSYPCRYSRGAFPSLASRTRPSSSLSMYSIVTTFPRTAFMIRSFRWGQVLEVIEFCRPVPGGAHRGVVRHARCCYAVSDAPKGDVMLVEDLERRIEALAPPELAEPWDNIGLLVGRRGTEVRKVLVALDLTEDVVVEAVTGDYQAIVTHHPLIFAPLKRVTDRDRVGVMVTQLIAADVALFACHTNLDAAPGGLNDVVAR